MRRLLSILVGMLLPMKVFAQPEREPLDLYFEQWVQDQGPVFQQGL